MSAAILAFPAVFAHSRAAPAPAVTGPPERPPGTVHRLHHEYDPLPRPLRREVAHGRLPHSANTLWAQLYQRAWRTGACEVSVGSLATDLGITTRGTRKLLRRLEAAGWLLVDHRWGARSRYVPLTVCAKSAASTTSDASPGTSVPGCDTLPPRNSSSSKSRSRSWGSCDVSAATALPPEAAAAAEAQSATTAPQPPRPFQPTSPQDEAALAYVRGELGALPPDVEAHVRSELRRARADAAAGGEPLRKPASYSLAIAKARLVDTEARRRADEQAQQVQACAARVQEATDRACPPAVAEPTPCRHGVPVADRCDECDGDEAPAWARVPRELCRRALGVALPEAPVLQPVIASPTPGAPAAVPPSPPTEPTPALLAPAQARDPVALPPPPALPARDAPGGNLVCQAPPPPPVLPPSFRLPPPGPIAVGELLSVRRLAALAARPCALCGEPAVAQVPTRRGEVPCCASCAGMTGFQEPAAQVRASASQGMGGP